MNRNALNYFALGLLLCVTFFIAVRNHMGVTRIPGNEAAGVSSGVPANPLETGTDGSTVSSTALPIYTDWKSFTTQDGLPSNKVFCVRVDGDRVWAGTDNGLARYEEGRWQQIGVEDGLPHRAVLSLDISPFTGDLWIGTMGGLARLSGGRIDVFSQNNSGLSNNFVNDVQCDPEEPVVWVATAMGLSRLDVPGGTWEIYTQENTPMHEPWVYSLAVDRGLLYVGAWGAGVLEYQKAEARWREYRDPDKEMEIDLLPDDGPVHDVTAAVDFESGILWQASYFGLARYDGREWKSYFAEDSGLASNFVNFVKARQRVAYLCTDKGLSLTDGMRWITYKHRGGRSGEIVFLERGRPVRTQNSKTSLAHNFVLGADLQGKDIWIATEGGVSHGVFGEDWLPPDRQDSPARSSE